MRVGINTLFLIPGEVGGSQTYLLETLHAMLRLYPDEQYVFFTHLEDDAFLREQFQGCQAKQEYVCLSFKASNRYARILREQVELPRAVSRHSCDVLWSPGYTAPLFWHGPQVVTIHDMQYKTHPEDLSWLARMVTDYLVRRAVRVCTRIIAVSAFSKSEILKYTAALPDQVDVTLEACGADWIEPVALDVTHRALAAHALLPGTYLLCVANTYPHKNVALVARAFSRIAQRFPACKLVLVGKPRLGEPEVARAMAGVSGIVRLAGVSREDLRALFQQSAAFLFPSLYEGFGLPVLEAVMAGTPVITTRNASLPEVAGEFAEYVSGRSEQELADKVCQVLQWDIPTRHARIAAARQWAERFSWDETARLTVASLRAARNEKSA